MKTIQENPAAKQTEIDARGGHCVVVYKGSRTGKFRSVCHSTADPAADPCWTGPTRVTPAEAIFDGRGHHFGPEPFIDESAAVSPNDTAADRWAPPSLEQIAKRTTERTRQSVTSVPSAGSADQDLPFADYLMAHKLSPRTTRDYVRAAAVAEAWFKANGFDLEKATPSQLVAYADTRPNTSGVRGHLRSALRYWWEWKGAQGWPDAIRLPSLPPMICKALAEDEAAMLIEAARSWWRPGTAVLAMAYLALRNAEVAAMRWDGFDDGMEWYTLVGKNNRQRTLPVHPALVAELSGHRTESPFVFEGRSGGPVSHATIWNWVREVAEKAGVEGKVWPHRIRHTTLAMMNDLTGDLRTVQTFAGHARPDTTVGYTRTTKRKLRAASDTLDFANWLNLTSPRP